MEFSIPGFGSRKTPCSRNQPVQGCKCLCISRNMVFDVKQPWVYISANVCTDRKRASQKQNPLQLSPDKFQGKTRPRCMWMWNLQEEGRSLPSCYYCAWWWALCLLPWSLELVVTLNWVFTLPFTESHMHQKHRGSQFSERRICAQMCRHRHKHTYNMHKHKSKQSKRRDTFPIHSQVSWVPHGTKKSSELQKMQVLQLFMRKMEHRIAKCWR